MQHVREFATSAFEAVTEGVAAALWSLLWGFSFLMVVGLCVAGIGMALEAADMLPHFPSEGERVAECRAMPGFPNYDRNMRFSGCEAQ